MCVCVCVCLCVFVCRYQHLANAMLVYFDKIAWDIDAAYEPGEGFYYKVEICTGVCERFSASARSTRLRVSRVPMCAHTQRPCACTLTCRSGVPCRWGSFLSASFQYSLPDLYFRLPAPSLMSVPTFRAAQTFDTVVNTTVIKRSDEPHAYGHQGAGGLLLPPLPCLHPFTTPSIAPCHSTSLHPSLSSLVFSVSSFLFSPSRARALIVSPIA